MQEFKIGDKINVVDGSWAFGIRNDKYTENIPLSNREGLTVIQTEICVCRPCLFYPVGNCDLLVTDCDGGYFFAISDLCELAGKKIELRYFCDGKDVTDDISSEAKKNLKT